MLMRQLLKKQGSAPDVLVSGRNGDCDGDSGAYLRLSVKKMNGPDTQDECRAYPAVRLTCPTRFNTLPRRLSSFTMAFRGVLRLSALLSDPVAQ